MYVSTSTKNQAKLQMLKEEALNVQGLSPYELAKILMAKYRMEVKLIIKKHIYGN